MFNTVVELVVGDNARLRYVCGQALSERSWIFGAQRAEVGRDASLDWVALGFGSARGHVRMETRLAGEGADARVTGAYATHGRQHIDFDTTQEHAAPNTTSDLAFRGVLQGRSTAVWKGNIIVDPGAQKTDAFQESRNLLISKRAHADAIPGLEIQANDVRCTHAAAIAQVDPEQLFYLRSHGLREDSRQAAGDRGLPVRARRALRGGPGARAARRGARAAPRARARGLVLERLELVGGELELHGFEVLLEVRDRARSRDRQHHRRVREQPRERDLAGAGAVCAGELVEPPARPGELPAGQRCPGQEREAVLLARLAAPPRSSRSATL